MLRRQNIDGVDSAHLGEVPKHHPSGLPSARPALNEDDCRTRTDLEERLRVGASPKRDRGRNFVMVNGDYSACSTVYSRHFLDTASMDATIRYTSKNCPVTLAIRTMGRRWKPLVLYYLKPGPLRFNELRRCIPEATQKMLTQTLRELEADGLIRRKVHPQTPPKVVYSTTAYGRSIHPILITLNQWGSKHAKKGRKKAGA